MVEDRSSPPVPCSGSEPPGTRRLQRERERERLPPVSSVRERVTVDEAEGSDEDDSGQPVATRLNLGRLLGDFTTFLLLLGRDKGARRIARSFAGLSLLVAIVFGSLSPLSLANFSTAFFSATTRHCLQCTHAHTFYVRISSTSFFSERWVLNTAIQKFTRGCLL